jgi:metal-responsive CopG/Arc/MetJ family transcriptional regulator
VRGLRIAFKVPEGLKADLDWLSVTMGLSRPEIVRRAVREALDYIRERGELPRTSYVPHGDGSWRLHLFTVRVEDRLYRELERAAARLNVPMSEVVRTAVFWYVERMERKYRPYRGRRVRVYLVT